MNRENDLQLELFSGQKNQTYAPRQYSGSFLQQLRGHERAIILGIALIVATIIAFSVGFERGKKTMRILPGPGHTLSPTQTTITTKNIPATMRIASPQQTVQPQPALLKQNRPLTLTQKPQLPLMNTKATLPSSYPQKFLVTTKPSPLSQKSSFSIQVASFKAKENAQQTVTLLQKQGLQASIVTKGIFAVLVGNYPDKKSAQVVLVQLKKQYRDCFIRTL